ncbi:hypothetical protein CFC21_003987 [Triticum aestivum]|uniref:Uncharacterized protein n=2 Tax=Triticum TaxID=4564 RepID=A0A9R0V394_TRITD|nr:uncharacterized protein LOC123067458 [Triticum aestivum]KAF6986199.1 hypothetical protein CFC21_003987 [Triticum aestivum]VAH10811.1 unnamed protein product [Triticum turgidum subsp. durum]
MLDWWCSPSSSAVWTAWRRALGAGCTLLFFSSSPPIRPGPWRPLVAGSTVDGAAGGVVADREKSLAGFPATTTATPPGVVFLLGGAVEVRLPPSLPLSCPGENSSLFRLGGSGVSCVVIFLKVPPWVSWGCAGAMGVVSSVWRLCRRSWRHGLLVGAMLCYLVVRCLSCGCLFAGSQCHGMDRVKIGFFPRWQQQGMEGLNLVLIPAGAVLLSALAALAPLLASSSSTSLNSSFSSLGVDYCVLKRLFVWCS